MIEAEAQADSLELGDSDFWKEPPLAVKTVFHRR
jgi:hypothetical protein